MTTCFEKARELGELIKGSEPGKRLAEAYIEYENTGKTETLVSAEKEFNFFTEQVFSILQFTINGETFNKCSGCKKGGC